MCVCREGRDGVQLSGTRLTSAWARGYGKAKQTHNVVSSPTRCYIKAPRHDRQPHTDPCNMSSKDSHSRDSNVAVSGMGKIHVFMTVRKTSVLEK